MATRTNDGRRLRLTTLIDKFSRRCLAIHVARPINALDVIETLADVMLFEGIPADIRLDGPEMLKVLRMPRRSSSNGVSTITPDGHTQPSVTGRPHRSPSRRHHQPSTGRRSCNNLSLRLVQNIGQARCQISNPRWPARCNHTLWAMGDRCVSEPATAQPRKLILVGMTIVFVVLICVLVIVGAEFVARSLEPKTSGRPRGQQSRSRIGLASTTRDNS